MSAPERRQYTVSNLFRFLALLAFIAAFIFAEGWLTKGNWQEFIAAGLSLYVAAEFV